jgi:SAM-dependent methyltransferase
MLEPAVEKPMPVCRSATCWRSQFAHPQGWRGWVVGHLMALKNRERSLWVLSLLGVRPDDRVLEIGFGPGVDIRRIAQRVRAGFVAGIDHSEMMLRQATERNRDVIPSGASSYNKVMPLTCPSRRNHSTLSLPSMSRSSGIHYRKPSRKSTACSSRVVALRSPYSRATKGQPKKIPNERPRF